MSGLFPVSADVISVDGFRVSFGKLDRSCVDFVEIGVCVPDDDDDFSDGMNNNGYGDDKNKSEKTRKKYAIKHEREPIYVV